MLACQNCGANVKFDIASQQMRCEYCDSYFDPYSYDKKETDGIEVKDFDATIFICPQCGGEILSTDNTAAGFCSWNDGYRDCVGWTEYPCEYRPFCIGSAGKADADGAWHHGF